MKLKTYFFFEDSMDYMGLVIETGRLGISIKAPVAIRRLQIRTNMSETKLLLCFCNIFWGFVLNFAGIDVPFNCKLEKIPPFNFNRLNETEVEVLETLQHELLSL